LPFDRPVNLEAGGKRLEHGHREHNGDAPAARYLKQGAN
jgi:hypothetical protein